MNEKKETPTSEMRVMSSNGRGGSEAVVPDKKYY
jgi:hypothetical protein